MAGLIPLGLALAAVIGKAQTMPATEGETLSGHRMVLAQAVQGHASIVIGSFSKDAGSACEEWSKAIQADPALAAVTVYQAANLERAPGFVRGMVKSSMRKQTPVSIQDRFIVFTQDDAQWRSYFGVTTDKDPYVVLMDASGQVRWHGHGAAAGLEPLLKAALK
ncbi:MAG: hypothetical protein ABSF53_03750 [Terracidiphilus sp.]